jgi:hypothetical protein
MTNARVLASRLADLLSREHAAMADFLIALADFDRSRSWLELGYSSLFYFLHQELGLSKGAAHYRKTAAELIQRFPEIVEPLRDGRLCITGIVPLARVLTTDNRREMLPKFFQRSKREAMAIAAALQPAAAPHRDLIVPVRGDPVPPPGAAPAEPLTLSPSAAHGEEMVQPVEPRLYVRRDSAEPLTEDLSRLHVTVSRRFLDKLEAARAALSHARPGATIETILEAGLDVVLERHARRRGLVQKPRKAKEKLAAEADRSKAQVKREVWIRDRGRCQWPLESGGICGSRCRVEFDHRVARALGGKWTTKNIRLLCRVHNDLAARLAFGNEWMNQFTGKGAREGSPQPAVEPVPSSPGGPPRAEA